VLFGVLALQVSWPLMLEMSPLQLLGSMLCT
jgi:hypothetical protein